MSRLDRARMPVLFVGHGSPLNAIADNRWSRGFAALREGVPRPEAILAISAHWYVGGTYLTGNAQPPTIHDFSGFPKALHDVEYPAPGHIEVARQAQRLLGSGRVALSDDWGLDHGTWSVLRWMYPEADVPVVQLSIDHRLDVHQHHDLARLLIPLRDEGILILGSGNVVHNLRDAYQRMRTGSSETPIWAQRFDEAVQRVAAEHDTSTLLSLWPESEEGRLAHPTADHWLPFVYAFGAATETDRVSFPMEGFDLGSLSMRIVSFGQTDSAPFDGMRE